jgi:hypothetical protein
MTAAGHTVEYASIVRVWFDSARTWVARFPLSIIQLAMRIAVQFLGVRDQVVPR